MEVKYPAGILGQDGRNLGEAVVTPSHLGAMLTTQYSGYGTLSLACADFIIKH